MKDLKIDITKCYNTFTGIDKRWLEFLWFQFETSNATKLEVQLICSFKLLYISKEIKLIL